MFAGSVASLAVLGAPDIVVLTLTEFAEQAYRINRAGKLPLLVDADHGYGNALNVKRTVEELETAGVAGLTIEDTLLPTPYGASDTKLIPIAEGVGKMRAALAGRQDPRLVIVGRTSALTMTGVADTIARLKAYEEAGADMLFMAGVKSRAELDEVASAVKRPLFLGSAGKELYDLDYLSARNVRVCLQGHSPFMAAVNAVHATQAGDAPGRLRHMDEGLSQRQPKGLTGDGPASICLEGFVSRGNMAGVRDAAWRRSPCAPAGRTWVIERGVVAWHP